MLLYILWCCCLASNSGHAAKWQKYAVRDLLRPVESITNTHGFGSPVSIGTRPKLTREAEWPKKKEYFTTKYKFGTKLKDLITEKDLASDDERSGTRCSSCSMGFNLNSGVILTDPNLEQQEEEKQRARSLPPRPRTSSAGGGGRLNGSCQGSQRIQREGESMCANDATVSLPLPSPHLLV